MRYLLPFVALMRIATAAPPVWHFEHSDGVPDKIIWESVPGYSYDLWYSSDLENWTHVDGFPRVGGGTPIEHAFTSGTRGFFKMASAPSAPVGFVWIPGGSFEMGDSFGEGSTYELPVHSVLVSGFYMQSTEVTNDQMRDVLQWAYAQRPPLITVTSSTVQNVESNQELLDLDDPACRITWNAATEQFHLKAEKGSLYPCVCVTWYGSAAWCNYRSAMEGLTPCYDLSDWSCNFSAIGYRLPTEAEWEKAARSGQPAGSSWRFPWGDEINHSHANYKANGNSYTYDMSPYTTNTYHPDWDDGGFPYTSPVGRFAATGGGLFDMAGNVREWCHDNYLNVYYGTPEAWEPDPVGPAWSQYRVLRGGDCRNKAIGCRVSARSGFNPASGFNYYGFRPARRAVP